MGELETAYLFSVGIIALIGVLILQWIHKLGFKLAKVETSEIPGFSKRFLIQIAGMLVGYGLLYLVGKLFDGASDADVLALATTITTFMSNSIGNMYIVMLIIALITPILYWVELMIAGKLLVSHLTVKTHLVAAIPLVVVVLIFSALPFILTIVANAQSK